MGKEILSVTIKVFIDVIPSSEGPTLDPSMLLPEVPVKKRRGRKKKIKE